MSDNKTPRLGKCTYHWKLTETTTVAFGGPEFDLVEKANRVNWLNQLDIKVASWVVPLQQHGGIVLDEFIVSSTMENKCDGLVSSANIGLAVLGSDCPGLVIVSDNCLGIAHCGWRGINSGIVSNLIEKMCKHASTDSRKFSAFIGPGICQKCYVVKQDVLSQLNWPEQQFTAIPNTDQYTLDLPGLIMEQCSSLGIEHIIESKICTHCDPKLHSYRYQGPNVIQALAIFRTQLSEQASTNLPQ